MNSTVKHIHITGASGSGTTTLGKALSAVTPYIHFDTDDFFWKTKYTAAYPLETRMRLLEQATVPDGRWILSGSITNWGNAILPRFDLVIFLSIPDDLRLQRLEEREQERYGDEILPGGPRHREYTDFMNWAAQYETGGVNVRSRVGHEEWLMLLTCPIVRIEGDTSVEERVDTVLQWMANRPVRPESAGFH